MKKYSVSAIIICILFFRMEVLNKNMKWKVEKKSTPEDVFAEINNRISRPVSIVLFGADYYLKVDICKCFLDAIKDLRVENYSPVSSLPAIKKAIGDNMNVMVVLSSDQSENHSIRHKVVTELKSLSVATIIGVYAAGEEMKLQNSPSVDGFNYLITI